MAAVYVQEVDILGLDLSWGLVLNLKRVRWSSLVLKVRRLRRDAV